MAKTSLKVSQKRTPKFQVQAYNRCKICGRPHAYMRKFGINRVTFRKMANDGKIPGITKASW